MPAHTDIFTPARLPKPATHEQRKRYQELFNNAVAGAPRILHRRPLGLHPAWCCGNPPSPTPPRSHPIASE